MTRSITDILDAERESSLQHWPAAWGDALQIIVSYDYVYKPTILQLPQLGISLTGERAAHSPFPHGYLARVSVAGRTQADVDDAVRRINDALGLLSLINYASRPVRWYCHLTHLGLSSSHGIELETEYFDQFLDKLVSLPADQGRLLRRALYWIRMAAPLQDHEHRTDLIRQFEMYWNAFECMANAYLLRNPIPIRDKRATQDFLKGELEGLCSRGKFTMADIDRIKAGTGSPGQLARLVHAASTCFGTAGDQDKEVREFLQVLLRFRHRIKHADIDAEENETLREGEGIILPLRYLTLDFTMRFMGRAGVGGWDWIKRQFL